jgi:single-stranded DNA-binding protein
MDDDGFLSADEMRPNVNHATLAGRVGKKFVRPSSDNHDALRFLVHVEKTLMDGRRITTAIPCCVAGKSAAAISAWLKADQTVAIEGELQRRRNASTGDEGLEVYCRRIERLDPPAPREPGDDDPWTDESTPAKKPARKK